MLFQIWKREIEDNITKDIKKSFRLRKQIDGSATKNIANLFRPKTENKTIKDKIIRDIKLLFRQEDNYYKPVREGNFWNNNYIEYDSNGNKNKNNSKRISYTNETLLKRYYNQSSKIWYMKSSINNCS